MAEMKSLNCKDAGVECDLHICSSDESELIALAQDHARRVHGVDVPAEKVKALIKTGDKAVCPS